MKNILSLLLLALLSNALFAQAKIGQPVTNVEMPVVLNAQVTSTSLDRQKGKIIWLEFWATYCAPCVEAMPDLQRLQETFKNKLQIVTVSTEKEKRVKQFIQNKPSNLWFAVDSADVFRKQFPYHTIPHSVLIDENGMVVAITEPKNITAKVIDSVLAGLQLHLPIKKDNMVEDPWTAYFFADPATQSRFLIQPKIEGAGSASKSYQGDKAFKNRRLSMINLPLENACRIAYGNLPYGRTIDLTAKEATQDRKTMYCMDLIVPKGHEDELLPTLQRELKSRFDLQASVERRMKPVYILTVGDKDKIAKLKRSTATREAFEASHGLFYGEHVPLKKIADYLESFGLENLPVVDETGDTNNYDIEFNFMPEKKGDLENTLQNLGLKLTRADREIDMLVFR